MNRLLLVHLPTLSELGGMDLTRAPEALTGLRNGGSFQGRHLRLPGHGERGPTLEIFQSNRNEPSLHFRALRTRC